MPDPRSHPPGKGLFGWLGRQIGYVSGAVKADPGGPSKAQAPRSQQQASPPKPAAPPKVIYRDDKVEEVPHPTQPGVMLRRTIIDEVVVEEPTGEGPPPESPAR